MKNIFYSLSILILFSSCSSKQERMLNEIAQLEAGDSTISINDVDQLMALYADFAQNFPEHERSEAMCYRTMNHYYHLQDGDRADELADFYLEHYSDGRYLRRTRLIKAGIRAKMKNDPKEALKWYEQANMSNATPTELIELYQVYELWSANFPQSDSAAWYWYQAAAGYTNLGDALKGVALCDSVYVKYPKTNTAPKALFLKAFTAENQLADLQLAENSYRRLVEEYPNDSLAMQAKLILDQAYLGLSADELLKKILNKNQ